MTPYSLHPPPPSLQPQTQIFISSNNQDCPTFFNIFDPRKTIQIGGFTQSYQQDEKMVILHDGSSSNNLNSPEPVTVDPISSRNEGNLGSYKMDEEDIKHSDGSEKWMSSKMRLMKKMMRRSMSPTSDRLNPQGQESRYSQRSPRNTSSSTTRVCSDCNTSTTPLWRSGPKGPKSLCNACGIRQRKARRAMAEASNGLVTPINSVCAKTRVYNKEKKSRANHFAQFKNKYKSTTTTTTAASAGSSEGLRKIEYFKDFAISLSSKNSSFQQKVFPRDEVAEAAMLLMELSCGFVH
ncbi:putative GATA transcription factor [Vigna angularis]|uniref:GATA-type domain-containing protein n=3 Tax=Phaseolus angularis TaxID=3914 RepID=A0A0S3RPP8_PHAAN|nr:putative GATA transcription factor 22 [Vigna angularis]KAG2390232.1 putative GATA transcription factor [Vigna angularis]BAT82513.1 hypothetical protein VIGAN_03254200 [Vigna angularis var. angularis]